MTQRRYQSVIQFLSDGIAAGRWPVDAQVPSENELVELCSVSRMTARRALEELTEAGVLYRVQGKGTFVSPPKMQASFVEVRNIADEIRALGQHYRAPTVTGRRSVRRPAKKDAMQYTAARPTRP